MKNIRRTKSVLATGSYHTRERSVGGEVLTVKNNLDKIQAAYAQKTQGTPPGAGAV
jgi:hypothetical protein